MNTKLNHYNRRIAPRLAEVIPLVLHTDRNMVESGRAINISSSGMRLVVQGGLAENEEVTLYFHLRGESSEVLQVGGRAVWQEKLGSFGPVVCVKGNCDRFLYRQLPHSVAEELEQVKVGMIHGWDLPLDHVSTVKSRFATDIDIIIHGHTHQRRFQELGGDHPTTIINPGSVSSPRGGETPGYGVLVIDGDKWSYQSHSFSN